MNTLEIQIRSKELDLNIHPGSSAIVLDDNHLLVYYEVDTEESLKKIVNWYNQQIIFVHSIRILDMGPGKEQEVKV